MFNICKCIIRLNSNKDAISNRQVDRDGDLTFAHECHHLIFDGHIANHRWSLYFADNLFEEITQIVLFFLRALTLMQFAVKQE